MTYSVKMNKFLREKPFRDFLDSLGVEVKRAFLAKKKHFYDDKEARNVYAVNVIRGEKTFSFEFGDSIANTRNADCSPFTKTPSSFDVMSCLMTECPDTIDDFVAEFGYSDAPISQILKMYDAVKKESEGLRNIFNHEELEKFRELVNE